MTTNNNTLKSGTPTKKTTLAGIRKQRRDSEAREKAKNKKDGATIRKQINKAKKKGKK